MNLPLAKPGDAPVPALTLNLSKSARFNVPLFWDSAHDLDAHAFALVATPNGNKLRMPGQGDDIAFSRLLSTYNPTLPLADGSASSRTSGDKRPFKLANGSLIHSGDARSGVHVDVDEIITIDGSQIPADVVEIPIFVTIHGNGTFKDVAKAGIRIENETGKVIASYQLTSEFAPHNVVQMGSFMPGPNGWEFSAVGHGFTGDLNFLLGNFAQ